MGFIHIAKTKSVKINSVLAKLQQIGESLENYLRRQLPHSGIYRCAANDAK